MINLDSGILHYRKSVFWKCAEYKKVKCKLQNGLDALIRDGSSGNLGSIG